jgi:hypothetical protein
MRTLPALLQDFVVRLEEVIESDLRARVLGALGVAKTRKSAVAGRARAAVVAPARRLQGQYIGLLRSLTGRVRQRVQATARKDGVRSALRLARQLKRS